ncbi:dehydrogenase family protein [Helicobacter didelphidarum]|uniref:hypothetical protein n=1 Tax=Helicobacter didelphidarum TaxID=2040648 RepID=UPI001FE8EC22|nr:hypothetical protein [Helicobacter didelphidarum]
MRQTSQQSNTKRVKNYEEFYTLYLQKKIAQLKLVLESFSYTTRQDSYHLLQNVLKQHGLQINTQAKNSLQSQDKQIESEKIKFPLHFETLHYLSTKEQNNSFKTESVSHQMSLENHHNVLYSHISQLSQTLIECQSLVNTAISKEKKILESISLQNNEDSFPLDSKQTQQLKSLTFIAKTLDNSHGLQNYLTPKISCDIIHQNIDTLHYMSHDTTFAPCDCPVLESYNKQDSATSRLFVFSHNESITLCNNQTDSDNLKKYFIVEVCLCGLDFSLFEFYALQYAISACSLGHTNTIIVLTNMHLTIQEYQHWQKAYWKTLKNYNIVESQCNIKTTQYIRGSFFHSFAKKAQKNITQDNLIPNIYTNYSPKEIVLFKENYTICNNKQANIMRVFALLQSMNLLLSYRNATFDGKFCMISGCNEMCIYLAMGLEILHARPLSLSNEHGFVYDELGLDLHLIQELTHSDDVLPLQDTNWLETYAKIRKCEYLTHKESFWKIPSFAYFLCDRVYQPNEANITQILQNGCKCVCEKIPLIDTHAIKMLLDSKICFLPFAFNSVLNFLAIYEDTTLEELSESFMQFYNKIAQNANMLKSPTDILMGILAQCCNNIVSTI